MCEITSQSFWISILHFIRTIRIKYAIVFVWRLRDRQKLTGLNRVRLNSRLPAIILRTFRNIAVSYSHKIKFVDPARPVQWPVNAAQFGRLNRPRVLRVRSKKSRVSFALQRRRRLLRESSLHLSLVVINRPLPSENTAYTSPWVPRTRNSHYKRTQIARTDSWVGDGYRVGDENRQFRGTVRRRCRRDNNRTRTTQFEKGLFGRRREKLRKTPSFWANLIE